MIHTSRPSDNGLSPPPATASHHDRTNYILHLLRHGRADELVTLTVAARTLGVPVKRLLDWRTGTARVRSMSTWFTSEPEIARLRDVLAGGAA